MDKLKELLEGRKYDELKTTMVSLGKGPVSAFDCCRILTFYSELHLLASGNVSEDRYGSLNEECFATAFNLFFGLKLHQGLEAMANVGSEISSVQLSRAYTRAYHIIISSITRTADQNINLIKREEDSLPAIGVWVEADCPARIDLAGGWTDTPPICSDFGGLVTGVAVNLNGKRPIGAKTKRVEEPLIRLILVDLQGNKTVLELKNAEDLIGYDQPATTGALLKGCLIYSKLIDLSLANKMGLGNYLLQNFGSGFEVHSWSNLPHGSGLGASSILAGCVLATLWKIMGFDFSRQDLVHGILMIEQICTTGGGWQDIVNGLWPGIKLGKSEKSENTLKVESEILHTDDLKDFYQKFEQQMVLVFTGDVRLAKNLLQDVIRQWLIGSDAITNAMKENYEIAQECFEACKKKDLPGIGRILLKYWEIKKVLAQGSETKTSKLLSEKCKDFSYGWTLCGAGGGGFMAIITKAPNMRSKIEEVIAQEKLDFCKCYDVSIDTIGIKLSVGDKDIPLNN